jgi:alkylated DNA nucleotide flippase Atl1
MAGGEAAATRGTGVAPQATPGDPQRMAAILMGNPQTADMGAQLALGQMQFAQNRAAQKEDTAASQAFQKELANIQQQFLTGQLNSQQAHAAQLAAQQRAHAAGLQTGQQQFLTQQAQAQQTFQGAENEKNRAAQLAQQQTAAALSKVPQGYQVSTQGGIAPIPGSPQATEAADLAKSKGESVVSVDRMIRSIDELNTHPGLEGTVGFSVGQRYIPGTDAASFDARLETLKSQAFLPMVAQLKGMGQLSDAEGKKLTAAIGALEPRMSEKEFRASLAEIKSDLIAARKRMGAPEKSTVETPSKPMGNLPALPGGFVIMDK